MGTITSGIGLISGLDIQGLVSQLMALEARPLEVLQTRIATTRDQQTAYTALNIRLTALKGAVAALARAGSYTATTATSSNDKVLTASSTGTTPVGSYSFTVRSLVSSHQLVSRGFRDRSATPVGAGSIVFESARANVAPTTALSALNNGEGVRRGLIRITDRSGNSADVDLTAALSVEDVLNAINGQNEADVRASVRGNAIVVTDQSGGTTTDLRIIDLGGGYAAADLGLAGSTASGEIAGHDLVALSDATRLARLNDGVGLRFDGIQPDLAFRLADGTELQVNFSNSLRFDTALGQLNDGNGVRLGVIRITNRAGESAEVDLTAAQTIQDVKDAIAGADIGVTLSAITGSKLVLSDASGETVSNLKIEDVTGYAAADLGIAGESDSSTLTGSQTYRLDTVGAMLRAIEYARDGDGAFNNGRLSVAYSANGLVFTDHTTGGLATEVTALNGSRALRDLGLEGAVSSGGQLSTRHLLAGLNTVLLSSLHGGQGVAAGPLSFTRRDGSVVDLDLSNAQTLSDVLTAINADGRLTAAIDPGGTRLRIADPTQGGGQLSATGAMAESLGLTSSSAGELVSGDLQLQYISENTRLADLNQGRGVTFGRFRITAADGTSRLVSLSEGLHKTVGDVLATINDLGMGVVARINANGDGIELEDTTEGSGTLTVAAEGSATTAAELGILGTAEEGILTGSFAGRIDVSASDTLDTLVAKINGAGLNVTASIINDGTGENPYRLVLSSKSSGTIGRVSFSTDVPGLSLNTLTEARDAAVVVGEPGSASSIIITSSTNSVTDVVPGMTLNLVSASDSPVRVTVQRNVDSVVTDVKTFIKTFNDAMDGIAELTRFVPETNARGLLQGERVVQQIQSRLFRVIESSVNDPDLPYSRLRSIGVMVDSSGGQGVRLTLSRTLASGTANQTAVDGEAELRAALAADPEAVRKMLTWVDTDEDGATVNRGIAARLNAELDAITSSAGGLIASQNATLGQRIEQFEAQAVRIQGMLDQKQARLYAQFQAMEKALAGLQGQQSALTSLANLVTASANTGT